MLMAAHGLDRWGVNMSNLNSDMQITELAAKYVIQRDETNISIDDMESFKLAFLDWIACAVEGQNEKCLKISKEYVEQMESQQKSTIIGSESLVAPLWAAFLNATASHSQDFDDIHSYLSMHLETPVISAALAVAEYTHSSGRDFIIAVIRGMQIMTALGDAVLPDHASHGWLPTSTLGVFGATAASGYLLKLNQKEMCDAFGLAASCSSGNQYSLGKMSKLYQSANASRQGLEVAILAKNGITANDQIFDTPYLEMLSKKVNREALYKRLYDGPSAIQELYIKPFPCGCPTHPGIINGISLVRENSINIEDISKIELWTYPRAYNLAGNPDPKTSLESKYSIPFCAVAGMCKGTVNNDTFKDEVINEESIQQFLHKVVLNPDSKMNETRGGKAVISLNNGEKFSKETHIFGRNVKTKDKAKLVEEKFRYCVSKSWGATKAQRIYVILNHITDMQDITDFTKLLR